jgi:hypothetical protein
VSYDVIENAPVVVRLAIGDGSVEPFGQQIAARAFPHGIVASDVVPNAVALTADGNLLIAGSARFNGPQSDIDVFVVRFDPAMGVLDTDFNGTGMVHMPLTQSPNDDDSATAIHIGMDGIATIAGQVRVPNGYGVGITQLDATTGEPVPGFNDGMPFVYDPCATVQESCSFVVSSVERSSAGRIVVGGSIANYAMSGSLDMFAARFNADGSPDLTFGSDSGLARIDFDGAADIAGGMLLQGDRVVLGGYATSVGVEFIDGTFQQVEHPDFALARLSDGRLFNDSFDATPRCRRAPLACPRCRNGTGRTATRCDSAAPPTLDIRSACCGVRYS